MSNIERKAKRAAAKRTKKSLKNRVETVERSISMMPTSCVRCGAIFDKLDKVAIDTWRICVNDGGAFLTCPTCYDA